MTGPNRNGSEQIKYVINKLNTYNLSSAFILFRKKGCYSVPKANIRAALQTAKVASNQKMYESQNFVTFFMLTENINNTHFIIVPCTYGNMPNFVR